MNTAALPVTFHFADTCGDIQTYLANPDANPQDLAATVDEGARDSETSRRAAFRRALVGSAGLVAVGVPFSIAAGIGAGLGVGILTGVVVVALALVALGRAADNWPSLDNGKNLDAAIGVEFSEVVGWRTGEIAQQSTFGSAEHRALWDAMLLCHYRDELAWKVEGSWRDLDPALVERGKVKLADLQHWAREAVARAVAVTADPTKTRDAEEFLNKAP